MAQTCSNKNKITIAASYDRIIFVLLVIIMSAAGISFPGCANFNTPNPVSAQAELPPQNAAPAASTSGASEASPIAAGSIPSRPGSSSQGNANSANAGESSSAANAGNTGSGRSSGKPNAVTNTRESRAEGNRKTAGVAGTAVGAAGDPAVSKTSSGPAPLGSIVPPSGPIPNIMASAIPSSGVELPIDLPSALRLAERDNPVIGEARARIGEALGRQQRAMVELLPMLNVGASFNGHTGVIQQSTGKIINLSRQGLYIGGGAGADGPISPVVPAVGIIEPLADAIYDPLAARQQVIQTEFEAVATANTVLLEVTGYYLELLAASAKLEAQRRSAKEAEQLMQITERYAQIGEGRPYDADRARTEWRIRRSEVRRAEEEKAIASARLCRRLHLDPSTQIHPASSELTILALIDLNSDLPALLQAAMFQRPEIKAAAANIADNNFQWKKSIARPLLPLLYLGFSGATFGGGSNIAAPLLGDFGGRTDFDVAAYWTLENFGIGNAMKQKQRRAILGEATSRQARVVNMVRDEVASSYGDARAQREQIEINRVELETAMEGFRRDIEQMLGAVTSGKVSAPRPIEVLNSLTLLARARLNLIQAVTTYNQSQFRLFVALGSPPPLDHPADPSSPAVPISIFSVPVATNRPGAQPAGGPAIPPPGQPAVGPPPPRENPAQANPQPVGVNKPIAAGAEQTRPIDRLQRDGVAPPGVPPDRLEKLTKAHEKSLNDSLEYDRLQEKVLQSFSDPAANLDLNERRDLVMKLAEAHRNLLRSKLEYDELLWGILNGLGAPAPAPSAESQPAISASRSSSNPSDIKQ